MILKLYKNLPQHLKVASISWISRGIFVLASLYSIKLATGLLDVGKFAIYAILTNIVAWLLLADVGLGYSIQNFISELKAKKENFDAYIFIGIAMTCFIGGVIALTLYVCNDVLSNLLLKKLYATSIIHISEGRKVFFYSSIFGLLTGIGMVSHKIFYAKQKGYWPNILSALASIITLLTLAVFKHNHIYDLFLVLIVFFVPNTIISFGPSLYFLFSSYLKCYKALSFNIAKIIFKQLFFRGGSFFIFTLTSALVLQIDYLVMSQTVPINQITIYNIVFKIYNAFFLVYGTLLLALWPSFSEWYVKREFEKIRKYCKKYIILGCLFILSVSLFFMLNSQRLLSLISTLNLHVSVITIALFCTYFLLRVWTDTFALILQSTSKIKALWIFTPIQAIFAFGFQLTLSKKFGINGILGGLILSFLFTVAWGLPYQSKKILTSSNE